MSSTHPVTPEQETKLRVKHRAERRFLVEYGYIEPSDVLSRDEQSQLIQSLPHSDEQALREYLRSRFKALNEILHSSSQSFDTPYITPDECDYDVTQTDNP